MDGDLASLMFDLDFDDEVHLIEHPQDPRQQNVAPANLSHEKNGEKGSSSGSNLHALNSKQELITADASNENAPSLAAPQMASTITPKANNNPAKESSEFPIQAGEKNNEAVGDDQVNAGSPENNNSGNNAHYCSQESSSNLQLLSSVPELSPSVTSPFSTPLSRAPTMVRIHDHVELGSPTGSNQSFLFNNPSSSHNNAQQNLMGLTNLGFWGNIIDPSLLNATNMHQNRSNFINSPSTDVPRQNPYTTVEMMPQFGRLGSTPSENSHQNQHLLPQGMNLSNSIDADHQLVQNVLQSSTWLGNANQQLPNWFSNQNATFSTITQSRPQLHPANNPVSENFLNSLSMMPEQPLLTRPQNLSVESNQLLPFAANYGQETQVSTNTMLPSVVEPLRLRPPQFHQLNQQQLNNQAAETQDLFNLQSVNPLQLNNSLLSRSQQSCDDQGGLNLGHNMIDTQHDNSLILRQIAMPSRANNFDLQGLLNQPIRPIPTYPTPGSSIQLTNQLLNSPTQQDTFGGNNPPGSTPQLDLFSNRNNEQSFLRRRNRASNMYDIGESSSSSSSSKRSKISQFLETGSTSQCRENALESLLAANPFNHPRPIKNALYDPIYESLGLPIDPHLRMFVSKH